MVYPWDAGTKHPSFRLTQSNWYLLFMFQNQGFLVALHSSGGPKYWIGSGKMHFVLMGQSLRCSKKNWQGFPSSSNCDGVMFYLYHAMLFDHNSEKCIGVHVFFRVQKQIDILHHLFPWTKYQSTNESSWLTEPGRSKIWCLLSRRNGIGMAKTR